MSELRKRLRIADRIPVEDAWDEIERRAEHAPVQRRRGRLTSIAVALVVAAVGLAGAQALLLGNDGQPGPGAGPLGPSATPARDGMIAFVRADPATGSDGVAPRAALFVMDPQAESVRKVFGPVDFRSRVAWSPDGTQLVVQSQGFFQILTRSGVPVAKVNPCEDVDCIGSGSPVWSPTGRSIYFWRDAPPTAGVWRIDVAGGSPTLVYPMDEVTMLQVSPDGRTLGVLGADFDAANRIGPRRIVLVSLETGQQAGLISPPEGVSFWGSFSWSSDGAALAFDGYTDDGRTSAQAVYLMRTDGSNARPITQCPEGAGGCIDTGPVWAPNGEQLVFTRYMPGARGSDGSTGDLALVDLDSGSTRILTSGVALDCCAAWGSGVSL